MLVCLRETGTYTQQHEESFLPQDTPVFACFQACLADLLDSNFPKTPAQHVQFNKAHLTVVAWLTVYCQNLSYYLEDVKQKAGCCPIDSMNQQGDLWQHYHHQTQLCSTAIVYHLAAAIHLPSSGFTPHSLFIKPDVCQHSRLDKFAAPATARLAADKVIRK